EAGGHDGYSRNRSELGHAYARQQDGIRRHRRIEFRLGDRHHVDERSGEDSRWGSTEAKRDRVVAVDLPPSHRTTKATKHTKVEQILCELCALCGSYPELQATSNSQPGG